MRNSLNINEVKECVCDLLTNEITRLDKCTGEVEYLLYYGLSAVKEFLLKDIFNYHLYKDDNVKERISHTLIIIYRRLVDENALYESEEERRVWYQEWSNRAITEDNQSIVDIINNIISYCDGLIHSTVTNINNKKRVCDPYYDLVVEYVASVFASQHEDFNDRGKEYVKDFCYELMIDNKDIYQNAVKGDENSIDELIDILVSFFINHSLCDILTGMIEGYSVSKGDVEILLNTDKYLQNHPDLIDKYNHERSISYITYDDIMKDTNREVN